MSLASWFHLPKLQFASDHTSSAPREPLWGRPRVEQLEDRMLLTAGSANQQGYLNNASINFNTQAIGLTAPSNFQRENPLAITQIVNGMQSPLLNGVAIGAQANLLTQSQVYDQFRAFGVNSMGQSGQGSEFQQFQGTFMAMAMGFGSGTMPNAPWMPAAYNVGLGNHQFNYPSQADHGFPPAAPWFQQSMQRAQNDQRWDDAQTTRIPEWRLIQHSIHDHERDQEDWRKENTWDQNEEKIVPDAKKSVQDESELDLRRGDPAIENALFTELMSSLPAQVGANRSALGVTERPNVNHEPDANENAMNSSLSENETIPSPLVISAIAPAQMAALVAGLPGVGKPAAEMEVSFDVGASE